MCVLDTTLCDKVWHWLATGRCFSPGPPVTSTNKTDCHDITEILLKVALNTITRMPIIYIYILSIWKESRISLCSSLGKHKTFWDYGLSIIVFNATFNNISVISWRSVLLVEETRVPGRKPPTCHKSLTNL
jgi:hypothetical protein